MEQRETKLKCEVCGDVDMDEVAQHLRKVAYGTPVWQDNDMPLRITPMSPQEREEAYAKCPYHVLTKNPTE